MIVYFIFALCGMIVALLIYGFISNYLLTTDKYNIQSDKLSSSANIKIVLLADLHGCHYGVNNIKLIDKVKNQRPDMICIAGDMTVKDGKGTDLAISLCKALQTIAPVYYSVGNHEIRMTCYEEYLSQLRALGITVLIDDHLNLLLHDTKINLYGLDLDEFYYHKWWQKRNFTMETLNDCLGTTDKTAYNILLAHNPEYFSQYSSWGADLVLSGHVHGGIAKLPLLGGVIDPSLRIFPTYDSGIFKNAGSNMVLSRGLGTHHIKLRFFNRPEISVITLSNGI